MDRQVHEAALRAAAKIALTLGAAGCASAEPAATYSLPTSAQCLEIVNTPTATRHPNERLASCCVQLLTADRAERAQDKQSLDSSTRASCCMALAWPGQLGCSPWGPPAPPRWVA